MQREHLRLGASAVLAALVHLGLVLLVLSLEEEDLFQDARRVAVQLVEVPPPPAAPVPEPEPELEPEPEPKVEPPPEAPVDDEPEPVPDVEPSEAPEPDATEGAAPVEEPTISAEPAPPTSALPEGSGSSVKVKERAPSFMDRVLGAGDDPFGNGLKELEGGLEYKADGPMSDGARAQKLAKRMIEDELAEDAVGAGLVDDYFRELRTRVQTAWRPAKKQLNDGGQHVTQLGFMQDLGQNPQAIGELWETYLDVAKQYARGEKLSIEKKRAERLRELFRSRKGNFRFHAITEVVVTQAADGQILTIEIPLTSGHPGFDEGVHDAFVMAARVMQEKPPPRLSNGRPFRSTWRLRATWIMVPPTALLAGNSWDITPDGVQVDVPFQIKLHSRVLLLGFDNRDYSIREQR